MTIRLPELTPGKWETYEMKRGTRTVIGRFVQVVHESTVTRIAEFSAEAGEVDQNACAAVPDMMAALADLVMRARIAHDISWKRQGLPVPDYKPSEPMQKAIAALLKGGATLE